MQQRYYDPLAGRFLSVDPVTTDWDSGESFNRYVYAQNNPYRYTDPDGRNPALVFRGAQALVALYRAVTTTATAGAVAGGAKILAEATSSSQQGGDKGAVAAAPSAAEGAAGTGQSAESGEAGKARNAAPGPLPEAEGRPHSIIERPGSEGQYTTHNGDGTSKQYRGSGKDHGPIPRPNVKEVGKNVTPEGKEFTDKGRVRPAKPEEVPKN